MLVPNVVRGADDFASGAADMFFFAFGAPKVREVDATVGGIRALEIPDERHGRPRKKILPYGYLTPATPGPFFVGVEKPMNVYTWDNMLFTNAKVKDDVVYKIIDTLENNKADLVAVQPALREFTAAGALQELRHPLSPGRLEIFQGPQDRGQGVAVSEDAAADRCGGANPAASPAVARGTDILQASC